MYPARYQNTVNDEKYYMAKGNTARWAEFQEALKQWKNQAEFANSETGKLNNVPFPDRPKIPDEEFFDDAAFDRWWQLAESIPTGQEVTPKFYITRKPFKVDESAFTFGPPAPVYNNAYPVGRRYAAQAGVWFENVGGPAYQVGAEFKDEDRYQTFKLAQPPDTNPFDGKESPLLWGLVGVTQGL